MQHEDYFAAAIPEPTTILGLRLRPFSLGHVVLLHRVKSSFVTEGESLSIQDIALSVLICAGSYQDGVALLNDTGLDAVFTRWHRNLTKRSLWDKLRRRKGPVIDYAKKASEFGEYLKRGSKIPDYSYQPGDFKEMHCPSVQVVKVTLMRDMHIPERELFDRSWALCLWDYVTLKSLAGHIRMVDSDAISEAQAVAEKVALAIKEGKCRF